MAVAALRKLHAWIAVTSQTIFTGSEFYRKTISALLVTQDQVLVAYTPAYFAAFARRVLKMIKRTNANCKVGITENDGDLIAVFINRK